jgi:hypothetical protein
MLLEPGSNKCLGAAPVHCGRDTRYSCHPKRGVAIRHMHDERSRLIFPSGYSDGSRAFGGFS